MTGRFFLGQTQFSGFFDPLRPKNAKNVGSRSVIRHIYICYRLQKRGPIFVFIGSKTGPEFEVEMGNQNNKKKFPPRCWVVSVRLTSCDFELCARTLRGLNNGAGMLYNIAAPILNPCPAPFSNARFPAPKPPFRKTISSAQTPFFKARKTFLQP